MKNRCVMTLRDVFPSRLIGMAAALALASILVACGTSATPPQSTMELPTAYKEAASVQGYWKVAQPSEAEPHGEWWHAFNDPALDELLQRAEVDNPGLAAATARVKAARALLRGGEAERMPQVNLQAGVTRQKQAVAQVGLPNDTHVPPAAIWQAGLEASYEVDLFQRVANGVQAAQADVKGSEASLRAVRLALQADVAQAYYHLRTLDAEVDLLTRSLTLREQTLNLIDKRRAAGDVSELDLARARAERASTRAELQGLQGQRRVVEHTLALLLGQTPAAFRLEPLPLPADLSMPQVPAGLPSALLERRPDVVVAQARMMAANARVGQARSALFPAFVLTAQGGASVLGLYRLV